MKVAPAIQRDLVIELHILFFKPAGEPGGDFPRQLRGLGQGLRHRRVVQDGQQFRQQSVIIRRQLRHLVDAGEQPPGVPPDDVVKQALQFVAVYGA